MAKRCPKKRMMAAEEKTRAWRKDLFRTHSIRRKREEPTRGEINIKRKNKINLLHSTTHYITKTFPNL